MERNGSFRKCSFASMVFIILAAVSVSALPPSETITCQGCSLLSDPNSADKFSAWVDAGKTITLIGPDGYYSYAWSEKGRVILEKSFTVKITSDAVYNLTLNGNKVKTVQVSLTSKGQSSCLPVISEIEIDGTIVAEGQTFTVAVGQTFIARVNIDSSQCPYGSVVVFSWTGDSSLFFKNPSKTETEVLVLRRPSGKNPELTAQALSGSQSRPKTISLVVVDNNKPTIESLSTIPEQPLSHKEIVFICDKCYTGDKRKDEGDHFTEFAVRVKSLDGKINRVFPRFFDKNSEMPMTVSVGYWEEGAYILEARIKDSRGAYSETFFDKLFVGFGNTGQDKPGIKLKEPVPCYGLNCTFDTRETKSNGLGLSRYFYYRTVSGWEPLRSNGKECRAEVCENATLPGSGAYEVKITMQYMRGVKPDGEKAEKTVFVTVSEKPAAAVSKQAVNTYQTVTPVITTSQPSATPNCGEDGFGCKTPGIGIFAAIGLIFLARRILIK